MYTDGTDGVLGFGRDFFSRPKALHGYVRYISGKVDNGDKIAIGSQDQGIIYVALSDKEKETEPKTGKSYPYIIRTKSEELFDPSDKNIITYGEKVFMASTGGNGLIEFTIELEYSSENRLRKPTSIVVVASSSRYGDFFAGSTGSTMWLDDLELIYE